MRQNRGARTLSRARCLFTYAYFPPRSIRVHFAASILGNVGSLMEILQSCVAPSCPRTSFAMTQLVARMPYRPNMPSGASGSTNTNRDGLPSTLLKPHHSECPVWRGPHHSPNFLSSLWPGLGMMAKIPFVSLSSSRMDAHHISGYHVLNMYAIVGLSGLCRDNVMLSI